ncbi:MAG: hypothetical protein ACU0D1_19535 [Pseudooceanicola nanhaiensis]
MTEQANPEIVRELAQAIFAVRSDMADATAPEGDRLARWQEERDARLTEARKLLRRLDAKGFTLAAKAG